MDIIFMGTSQFSVPFLSAALELGDVKLVVTRPDKRRGRGRRRQAPPLKQESERLDIDCLQPNSSAELARTIEALEPDVLLTVAYGDILPASILKKVPLALNVHASLLPSLRGAAPITRAIEAGHEQTGVSLMAMTEKMDAGPVYASKVVPIDSRETKGTLTEKLIEAGCRLLRAHLHDIHKGTLEPTPQDDSQATYAPKVKKQEGALDFNRTALELERKVRAFNPDPGAFLVVGGERIKVLDAKTLDREADPGTILHPGKGRVAIATAEGALELLRVQPPAKRPMDTKDFMNGRGRELFIMGGRCENA